jgi:predicted unusual protein kinase regulating ubiquinone biosynthesis (AarF/ABC1/UbiB family)/DNA-binding XRE family transcriptional regulator
MISPYFMKNGERIKQLRDTLGWSQKELAGEFNVDRTTVAHWEKSERPVPGPVIKLMDFYESSFLTPAETNAKLKSTARKLVKTWVDSLTLDGAEHHSSFIHVFSEELGNSLARNSLQSRPKLVFLNQLTRWMANSKGLAMKAAQLASYIHPSVPAEIRESLANALHRAKPTPTGKISRLISQELGAPPHKLFKKFSLKPFAVASIGQVHLAELKTGEKVAVKVQHPEIRKDLEKHLKALALFSRIMTYFSGEDSGVFEEIRKRVLDECDYSLEARNQESFREFFKDDSVIFIPKVFREFTTKTILTTEFVEGTHLKEFAQTATQERRNAAGAAMVRFQANSVFALGAPYADPHPGNYIFTNDGVAVIDFGRVASLENRAPVAGMYLALMSCDKKAMQQSIRDLGAVKNWSAFDFDEYWNLMLSQNAHLLSDVACRITPEDVAANWKALQEFKGGKHLRFTPDQLWALYVNASQWSLQAELKAEVNWRTISMDAVNRCLS